MSFHDPFQFICHFELRTPPPVAKAAVAAAAAAAAAATVVAEVAEAAEAAEATNAFVSPAIADLLYCTYTVLVLFCTVLNRTVLCCGVLCCIGL